MTTSGSVDYNNTGQELVTGAMRLLGVLASGESATASEMQDGLQSLNQMLKAWQADGFHLWKYEEGVVFLTVGKASYLVGPSGDQVTTDGNYTQTTLSSAAASGASSIEVASITGIANGDNIGVVLDDGSIDWTTVNGAPAGSTVTLTATLDSAAASGNIVYAHTNKIERPLKITDARRHDVSAGTDTPFANMIAREEYFDLPNKASQSNPTQGYYDPQLTNGVLYIWPTSSTSSDVVKFTCQIPIEDVDSQTNTIDFPQEWMECLKWNLAVRLGPEYDTPLDRIQWLQGQADRKRVVLLEWDAGDEDIYFQVDVTG